LKLIISTVAVIVILVSIGQIGQFIHERSMRPEEKVARARESHGIAEAASVAKKLKSAMRDPDSFALSSVRLIEKTEAVCFVYRARNGFEGINVGHAVLSSSGKFATDEVRGFHSLWNNECTKHIGREEANDVTFLLNYQ
jgi:hypothetical protein